MKIIKNKLEAGRMTLSAKELVNYPTLKTTKPHRGHRPLWGSCALMEEK